MSNTITTTTSPTLTFTGDSDTGLWFSGDDQLTIATGGAPEKQINNYKKVHVARRRQAKKLSRPEMWSFGAKSPTMLTVSRDP